MGMEDLLSLLKQFGPLVFVVGFFLWQNWLREVRMVSRIDKLEDEQRNVLLTLVTRCTDVIAKNTVVVERLETALTIALNDQLRSKRPQG